MDPSPHHGHSRSPSPTRVAAPRTPSPPLSSASSSTAFSPPVSLSAPLRKGTLHPFATDLEKQCPTPLHTLGAPLRPFRTKRLVALLLGGFLLGTGLLYYHAHSNGYLPSIPFGRVGHDESLPLPPSTDPPPSATSPPTPIESWGLKLKSERLLAGLRPWPTPSANQGEPLSELGKKADEKYNLGAASSMAEYRDTLLEFIEVAFPTTAKARMKERVMGYLGDSTSDAHGGVAEGEESQGSQGDGSRAETWDAFKMVWQTDKNADQVDSYECSTWRGDRAEGWKYGMVTDPEADKWLAADFPESRILDMWSNLPAGILRSDTLRYLLLLIHGGVYSDTDTILLKNLHEWGGHSRLWKDGEGWLTDAQKEELASGKSMAEILGRPSIVVGVEADVGSRPDWDQWWPRPIVQWTMASAQYHPIALEAVLRVLHNTATAVDWSHDHAYKVKTLKDLGRYHDSKALSNTNVLNEPVDGGPLGIVNWTGPSVWTDAVLSYLKVKFGMNWTDLRGLQLPLRVGDVVILPVTGFSPGVGQFGAKGKFDSQAMVEHKFKGSWKEGH